MSKKEKRKGGKKTGKKSYGTFFFCRLLTGENTNVIDIFHLVLGVIKSIVIVRICYSMVYIVKCSFFLRSERRGKKGCFSL